MKLTILGTGNATVTECYNTCFVISDNDRHFMVDGGGGNTILHQLKAAGLNWMDMRDIFVTHKHIDHGTSEEVLAKGVGHLEGTSLPIGGESTHTVLSGHTGLPEAEIFTKLESVKEGDIFLIHVLNETLAYKVDQIKVVEPSETDDLKIVPGYDYATLVTCTPYGINSHRLLVRGIRTEYTQDVSDEAAGQAEEGPDGGGWKAMYEKAIIEGILFAVILVVLINVIVRKFGKKNKSEVAIYDEKEKKEKKPCKKAGKRRRRKSKRTER